MLTCFIKVFRISIYYIRMKDEIIHDLQTAVRNYDYENIGPLIDALDIEFTDIMTWGYEDVSTPPHLYRGGKHRTNQIKEQIRYSTKEAKKYLDFNISGKSIYLVTPAQSKQIMPLVNAAIQNYVDGIKQQGQYSVDTELRRSHEMVSTIESRDLTLMLYENSYSNELYRYATYMSLYCFNVQVK